MNEHRRVRIDYTNWRGERRVRVIEPLGLSFTHTEHHPTPQWLVLAKDIEKGERRFFAQGNIHSWEPV